MVAIKKYRPTPEECVRMEGHCWEYGYRKPPSLEDGPVRRTCKHCGLEEKKVPESWEPVDDG